MALPESMYVIRVEGLYVDRSGDPATGNIAIFSDEHLTHAVDDEIIAPVNEDEDVDENGYFYVDVPASNSPGWGPENYLYTVKENLSTGVRSYKIIVPYDSPGGVFNLKTAVPVVDNPDPDTYVLIQTADQPGGYPRLDQDTGLINEDLIPPLDSENITDFDAAVQALSLAQLRSTLNLLDSGESVVLRGEVGSEVQMVSGTLHLTYWTAIADEEILSLKTVSGDAASGATLARIGIYQINSVTLAGTLIASIPNTLSLWSSPFSPYTPNLTLPFSKVAGQRYAVGLLFVGTTPPYVECSSVRYGSAGDPPRIQGELAGQADLPLSFTEASLTNSHRRYQMIVRPVAS